MIVRIKLSLREAANDISTYFDTVTVTVRIEFSLRVMYIHGMNNILHIILNALFLRKK